MTSDCPNMDESISSQATCTSHPKPCSQQHPPNIDLGVLHLMLAIRIPVAWSSSHSRSVRGQKAGSTNHRTSETQNPASHSARNKQTIGPDERSSIALHLKVFYAGGEAMADQGRSVAWLSFTRNGTGSSASRNAPFTRSLKSTSRLDAELGVFLLL